MAKLLEGTKEAYHKEKATDIKLPDLVFKMVRSTLLYNTSWIFGWLQLYQTLLTEFTTCSIAITLL